MRRRDLLRAGALGIATCALRPAASTAQQAGAGTPARIGRLSPLSAATDRPHTDGFRASMRELGWREGSLVIESRFADGKPERLPRLATELVQRRVDLIVAGSTQGALAAKNATSTVPIVMVTTGDPVADGIVASLARPGGNVTGVTAIARDLTAKRLEILKEALPGVTRIGVIVNPTSPYTPPFEHDREQTARALGLTLSVHPATDPAAIDRAFAAMAAERAEAVMVLTDVMFLTERRRIIDQTVRSRLPALYPDRVFVEAGGLMFYGASLAGMYRHAAVFADRILKGARPADLPVEQPTTLELVISAKAARTIGLTLPQSVYARADHIIE